MLSSGDDDLCADQRFDLAPGRETMQACLQANKNIVHKWGLLKGPWLSKLLGNPGNANL